MIKREILIEAPRLEVFETITQLEKYPEFVRGTESVRIHKNQTKDSIIADFTVNVVKQITYTLEFQLNKPERIQWHMVKGEVIKKNSGAWNLVEVRPNQTNALYELDIEFGWLVPKMIVNQLSSLQLPEMLSSFKARAEEVYNRKGVNARV